MLECTLASATKLRVGPSICGQETVFWTGCVADMGFELFTLLYFKLG